MNETPMVIAPKKLTLEKENKVTTYKKGSKVRTECTFTKLSKIINLLIQFKDGLNLGNPLNKELYRELAISVKSLNKVLNSFRKNQTFYIEQNECLLDSIDKY